MLLYDIVQDARYLLVDTQAPYRWSDEFFQYKYVEMANLLWSMRPSLFLDDLGRAKLKDVVLTLPILRGIAYVEGDMCHNEDGEIFKVTTAGTTDTNPVTYNLGYEATTTDGTVVFTNQERSDLPFPDLIRRNLAAYLIAKAYEVDSTDQNNLAMMQQYQQIFGEIL